HDFPRGLMEPVAGARLIYELSLHARDGNVAVSRRSLNPWIEAWDRAYGLIRRRDRRGASRLLTDPSWFTRLANVSPWTMGDGGSVKSGVGYVDVSEEPGLTRIELRKRRLGGWRIAALRKVSPAEPK